MKKSCASFLLVLSVLLTAAAQEDAAIKVTTTVHEDGTRTEMKTDPQAQTAEATTYSGDKVLRRIAYKLDAEGNMQEGNVFSSDGKLIFRALFKRDGLNRVVEEINYAPDGTLVRRLVYGYDSNGRIAKIDAFDAEGNAITESRGVADKRKSLPRRHR